MGTGAHTGSEACAFAPAGKARSTAHTCVPDSTSAASTVAPPQRWVTDAGVAF